MMKPERLETDAELELAARLDEYCRQLDSQGPGVASHRPEQFEHPDLSPDQQSRLSRAQAMAAQLAALSQIESTRQAAEPGEVASLVGQQFGRFEVRELVGVGGFGMVYRAYDPAVERDVALKVPRVETLLSAEARQRFLLEARTAARLDHPNIAAIMESGEIGGVPIIVSAFCEGITLAHWLRRHPGGVSPPLALEIVLSLAQAVAHAHAQGVLHRDIKPGNIIVSGGDGSAELRPRLTDFGLAKCLETNAEHTHTGDVLGTVGYSPPEQAAGRVREITTASDIYALGMILYELLTGRAAFAAETKVATLSRILTEDAVPPRRLNGTIPPDIEAICLKCLEKSPAARYRSANDLAEDLGRAMRGEPTMARPLSWPERTLRWGRKRPALAALATLSLMLLLTTIYGGVWYSYQLARSAAETRVALARAQASEAHSADLLYAAEMRLAAEWLERGETRQVRQLLDRQLPTAARPDRRTFIWHYLNSRIQRDAAISRDSYGQLYCQARPSHRKWIAVGGTTGRLRLLDAASLDEMQAWDTRQGEINAIAIDADDTRIATAGKDGTVALWSPGSEEPVLKITACSQGEAYAVAFTPDASEIITGGEDPAVRFWSTADGSLLKEVVTGHERYMDSFRVAPNGREAVAIDNRGEVFTIDLERRALLDKRMLRPLGPATTSQYSPDGTCLAVAGRGSGLTLLDADGKTRAHLGVSENFKHSLAWSNDSALLYVGDRAGTIHVVEVSGWRHDVDAAPEPTVVDSWQAHTGRVWSLAMLPDGSLASTGEDGLLRKWDTSVCSRWRECTAPQSTGVYREFMRGASTHWHGTTTNTLMTFDESALQPQTTAELPRDESSVLAVCENGETLAVLTRSDPVRTDSKVSVFRATDLRELGQLVMPAADCALNIACAADGRHLALLHGDRGNRVRCYELPTFREVGRAEYHNVLLLTRHTIRVLGQECFLICDNNDLIALRQADLREVRRVFGHKHGVYDAVASPDRQTVYTLGGDGLKAWNAATLELKVVVAGEHVQARLLAITPDGSTLLSAANTTRGIRLWDVRTSQQILEFSPPFAGWHCRQFSFTPDSSRLIVTHHGDLPAMILDTRAGPDHLLRRAK